MKKEIKKYTEDEYTRIYSSLNVGWKIGVKNKTEELINNGLANSGFEQQALTTLGIELVKQTNIKLKELFVDIQKKFDFKFKENELTEYINRSIKNNNSYLNTFEKELTERFDKKGFGLSETCRTMLYNAKQNSNGELKRIETEIILINKNKNKKLNKSDKINVFGIAIASILGIIAIVVPIIIFILENTE